MEEGLTLGGMIKGIRQIRGLSARELSQAIDKSPSYITKVELGEIEPSFRSFAKIARHLRLNEGEIYFMVRFEGGRS